MSNDPIKEEAYGVIPISGGRVFIGKEKSVADCATRFEVRPARVGVKVKRLHPSAVIPAYATDGSGCFDITALEMVQQEGNTAVYTTGLAFEVPPGKVLMLYSRSGHGFNRGIRLANCVGVIDSDYRGEVAVKLTRDNDGIWFPAAGERIAQGLIQGAQQVRFVEVQELSETARGTGGFGSTG